MDGNRGRVRHTRRRFEILVVCTANLCRSPLLEGLIRDLLADSPAAWTVSSAGTDADDGRPVHPLTARALTEHGIALPADWRSRRLRPGDVDRADLVLAASRTHRSEVVRTVPVAATRTFTVRQFLRLLGNADAVGTTHRHAHPGDVLLDAALAARGLGVLATPEADDIADPVGRPYAVFRDLAADLAGELQVLSDPPGSTRPVLTPAAGRPGPWWAPGSA